MTLRHVLAFCLCACACGRTTLRFGEEPAGDDDGDSGRPDPKICAPGPICAPFVNDPETGNCIRVNAPDGTPCDARCLLDATCVSGVCAGGRPASCDDGNACTADGCDAVQGCIHSAVNCTPADGPCEVAHCDPVQGCIRRLLTDGEPCGVNACDSPEYCYAGQCATSAGISPARLVAQWSFNDADGPVVLDSSSRGHDGTLVAGTRVPSLGIRGIANTGAGMLVDVPDHPDLAFVESFTVHVAIQTPVDPVMGQQDIVFRGDAREGLDPYVLSLQPGNLAQFVVMSPADGLNVTVQAEVPLASWVHITAVFDAVNLEARLYVQCRLATRLCSAFDIPMSILDPASSPGVGLGSHAQRGGMIYQFRGILDEVRLYDGALGDEAIAESCFL